MSKASFKKLMRYFPIVLLIALVVFSFKTHKNQNKLDEEFRKEQQILQKELDDIVADYRKMSRKKKGLSRRIITSINKIISLKDSVNKIKKGNYDLLVKYSVKVARLQRENRDLLLKADQLFAENQKLQEENQNVKKRLRARRKSKSSLNDEYLSLKQKEEQLKEKIGEAARVQIGKIYVGSYKERSNGRYNFTSRANKTDAFKIKFDLLENSLANIGEREIVIQIIDSKGQVVLSEKNRGSASDEFAYNDFIKVFYENQQMSIVSLVSVDRNQMKPDVYETVIYLDGRKAGESKIRLR